MTKPDDISQAIWDTSEQVIVALEEFVDFSNDGRITSKNMDAQYDAVQQVIARAILAERDRALEEAAGVADAIEKASRDEAMDLASKEKWQTANHWNAHADGCLEVSSAIRALKETP